MSTIYRQIEKENNRQTEREKRTTDIQIAKEYNIKTDREREQQSDR